MISHTILKALLLLLTKSIPAPYKVCWMISICFMSWPTRKPIVAVERQKCLAGSKPQTEKYLTMFSCMWLHVAGSEGMGSRDMKVSTGMPCHHENLEPPIHYMPFFSKRYPTLYLFNIFNSSWNNCSHYKIWFFMNTYPSVLSDLEGEKTSNKKITSWCRFLQLKYSRLHLISEPPMIRFVLPVSYIISLYT